MPDIRYSREKKGVQPGIFRNQVTQSVSTEKSSSSFVGEFFGRSIRP
jgi:hypothetical protein